MPVPAITTKFGRGIDVELMPTAAHEAGHAVAALSAGFAIAEIRIWRESDEHHYGHHGYVRLTQDTFTDEEHDDHPVVLVAGHEAEARWMSKHADYLLLGSARRDTRGGACHDLDTFRRNRRKGNGTLTEPQARAQARVLLARHWHRIERLALRLARTRHLHNPSA